MKTWVRKTLSVGVLAAGALLLAPGAAQADITQNTSDNNGILNGTQIAVPVAVPLNIVGNAIGVAGEANAAGAGANWLESGTGTEQTSSDNNGIGNGTQAYLPIWAPVNVVGNAVGVLGEANAAGAGVNGTTESARTESGHGGDQTSSDNNGVLNGTQIYSPIDIPINLCGNALSLLGEANAQAACTNGTGNHTESGSQTSSDNNGIANGTQVYAPISLPVNLAGNSVGVLGEGNAAAAASNESGHGDTVKQTTSDNNGILNGTQIAAPIDLPVNVCGNALGILGEANAAASCSNGGQDGPDNGGDNGGEEPYEPSEPGEDVDPDGGNQGGDYGDAPREAGAKSATEASPVSGLTDSLGGVSDLGGLGLLNTLR
jgi:hypothetical protein